MPASSFFHLFILLQMLVMTLCSAHLPPKFLYVWAGAQDAKLAKDSLFGISLAPSSFGKVVAVTETPYNGLEPHHCAITNDGRYLGAGGLLSVLSGLPSILFFDLKKPTQPKFIMGSQQPVLGSISDAVLPTPGNGFLITMMGSDTGYTPGRVVHYDSNLKLLGEYPLNNETMAPGFNPHGIAAAWARKTMVTSDFIEPGSTLMSVPGPIVGRSTVRLWDTSLQAGPGYVITKVYNATGFGDAGMLDTQVIGNTGMYYVTGSLGFLYLLDPNSSSLVKAFDVGDENRPIGHSMLHVFRRGTRLIMTLFAQSKIFLLDTTDPANPVKLAEVLFNSTTDGPAGSHNLVVSKDERLVAVCTYFLEEGPGGKVHAPGDQTVRLLTLDKSGKILKPHPKKPVLDFKNMFPGKGKFNPHGLAFKY